MVRLISMPCVGLSPDPSINTAHEYKDFLDVGGRRGNPFKAPIDLLVIPSNTALPPKIPWFKFQALISSDISQPVLKYNVIIN